MTKHEIKNIIKNVLEKNDIKKASLFGSYASNKFTDESDIDILIEFNNNNNKSLLDLIGIKQEIEEKINKTIDLLTYDSINPELKKYILNQQEIIL